MNRMCRWDAGTPRRLSDAIQLNQSPVRSASSSSAASGAGKEDFKETEVRKTMTPRMGYLEPLTRRDVHKSPEIFLHHPSETCDVPRWGVYFRNNLEKNVV